MDNTITATQEIDIGAIPEDARGNPAPIDVTIEAEWTVNPPEAGVLVAAGTDAVALGAEKTFRASGILGAVQITKTVDADPGAGNEPLTCIWNINVLAGKAVQFGQFVGVPRDQVFPPGDDTPPGGGDGGDGGDGGGEDAADVAAASRVVPGAAADIAELRATTGRKAK